MACLIDDLFDSKVNLEGHWFVADPEISSFFNRLKDAFGILTGRYQAVKFARIEMKRKKTKTFDN